MRFRCIAAACAAVMTALVFTPATLNAEVARTPLGDALTTFENGRYIVNVIDRYPIDDVLVDYPHIGSNVQLFEHVLHGFAANLTADDASALSRDVRISSISPDEQVQLAAPLTRTVTDQGLWGLDRIDQRNVTRNNTIVTPEDNSLQNVFVYVVDTGIRLNHQEFAGRIADFRYLDSFTSVDDCNGHGTHVAATAIGSNYGVAPSALVIPIKVLGCDGKGSIGGVIAAIDYIAQDTTHRPAVVNLSLGGGSFDDLDQAVNDLVASGVTVVVAAGNERKDACIVSPARVASAITVAATDSTDKEASFSNYGSCVDIFAPGVGVLSAGYTSNTAFALLDGTSMAAPHVAGAVALYLDANPAAKPSQVWDALRINATACAVSYYATRATQSPNRLLYIGNALGQPCPPGALKATVEDGRSVVTWSEPEAISSDGVTPITYTLTTSPVINGCVTTGFTCTLTGLQNGTQYQISVIADNGEYITQAAVISVTPEPPPGVATITGITIGNAQVSVSWGAVSSYSTVTYTAVAQLGGQSCVTSSLSCNIAGLTNGSTYTFTVTARNANSASAASAATSATLYTVPVPPVINQIRTTSKAVTLRWNLLQVPYGVTYTVRVLNTSRTCSTAIDTCKVTKLANGKRYRLTVSASNFIGEGPQSPQTWYVVPGMNRLRDTIKRKKKILLSKFMTTLSAGRKSYSITKGSCRISSGYLVAPSKTGKCTLKLSVSASGSYPSMYNTVVVKVT